MVSYQCQNLLVRYEVGPVDYEVGPVDYEVSQVDYEVGSSL